MTTDDLVKPAGPTEPATRWSLRPLLLRLHFYAGILVGPFLLIAAITGLLYIFTPQLEDAVYDHELHVPAASGTQSLSAQIAVAKAALPEGTVVAVRPAPSSTDTTQVIFDTPGIAESFHRTVFVDPHTTEVRGVLETYGSGQALPLRTWLDQLHQKLHLGDLGRLYSELAASWLWVVVGGGLVLWWGRRRRRKTATRPTGRARTMSWHATTGTSVALVLLFLSATGLTWSQFAGENISDLRAALSWQTPSVSSSVSEHHGAMDHDMSSGMTAAIGPDQALTAARTIGLSDPVELTIPARAGKAYVVKQIQRSWPEKQDSAAIDPTTGQVTDVLRFDDYPLMAKLSRWGIDAHMGLLFGLGNQLVLAVVCVGLIAVIIWGYRMWWQRRPTKDSFGFGRPFPRGSLRKLPPHVSIPVLAVTALVGWFLPVFGVSLLAFLVLDTFLGWRARVRD